MKFRTPILLTLIVLAGVAVLWRFYIVPHKRFHLGMSLPEIQAICGDGVEVVPVASAYSSPPTEFEKQHTTDYLVQNPSMGVDLYLNYYKRVVCIEFLLGRTLGTKEVVEPTSR